MPCAPASATGAAGRGYGRARGNVVTIVGHGIAGERILKIALSKIDFPILQQNPITVRVDLGLWTLESEEPWAESKPGQFKYP
jgi:hypothetical protein